MSYGHLRSGPFSGLSPDHPLGVSPRWQAMMPFLFFPPWSTGFSSLVFSLPWERERGTPLQRGSFSSAVLHPELVDANTRRWKRVGPIRFCSWIVGVSPGLFLSSPGDRRSRDSSPSRVLVLEWISGYCVLSLISTIFQHDWCIVYSLLSCILI